MLDKGIIEKKKCLKEKCWWASGNWWPSESSVAAALQEQVSLWRQEESGCATVSFVAFVCGAVQMEFFGGYTQVSPAQFCIAFCCRMVLYRAKL